MYIIIPAKPFSQSKSRLASVLSVEARAGLSRRLLQRTVILARQVGQVTVISRDPAARQLARQLGAWALVETQPDLNAALRQAAAWVMMRGGDTILILPADLPRLRLSELEAIVALAMTSPAAVISPCHRYDGTNGLLLRPPDLVRFSFGPGSFNRHCRALRAAGVEPVVYDSPGLAFDLDLPDDWARWQAIERDFFDLLPPR